MISTRVGKALVAATCRSSSGLATAALRRSLVSSAPSTGAVRMVRGSTVPSSRSSVPAAQGPVRTTTSGDMKRAMSTKPPTSTPPSSAAAAEKGAAEKSAGPASTSPPPPTAEASRVAQEVTPETSRKNISVGIFLVAFAAGTYYYTIHMMGKQDFLGEVEKEAEEEAMVHLSNSKLAVVEGKSEAEKAQEAADEIAAAVSELGEEAVAVVQEAISEPEPPKKKGRRKYWLFGPRVGGD